MPIDNLLDLRHHTRFGRPAPLFALRPAPLIAPGWEQIVTDLLDQHVEDLISDLNFLAGQVVCFFDGVQAIDVEEAIAFGRSSPIRKLLYRIVQRQCLLLERLRRRGYRCRSWRLFGHVLGNFKLEIMRSRGR